MGIPSYFSYVLRKHKNILTPIKYKNIDILFIDANSIIYDSLSDNNIYVGTYEKILNLIKLINPKKTYVMFDGIVPIAKMKQQKERRYKSYVTKHILDNKHKFNTNKITPGTPFMNNLDSFFIDKFKNNNDIYYSGPNEKGEGEHKILNIIRNSDKKLTNVIYGLDADLIMLSLLAYPHIIYLHRETKHFKYIKWVKEDENYYLNIENLANHLSTILKRNIYDSIKDYCILCFICGNDFLPHFPSINIRNNAIDYLINIYIRSNNKLTTSDNNIDWDALQTIFYNISLEEKELIKKENLWRHNVNQINITFEDRLNNLPVNNMFYDDIIVNSLDKYNELLFKKNDVTDVCNNYLDMFDWCWKYYNGILLSNTKYYENIHPPLFSSLKDAISIDGCIEKKEDIMIDIHPCSQLLYVLPYDDYDLIPIDTNIITNKYKQLKIKDNHIDHTFCRFFWESHVSFNYINFVELNKFIHNLS